MKMGQQRKLVGFGLLRYVQHSSEGSMTLSVTFLLTFELDQKMERWSDLTAFRRVADNTLKMKSRQGKTEATLQIYWGLALSKYDQSRQLYVESTWESVTVGEAVLRSYLFICTRHR